MILRFRILQGFESQSSLTISDMRIWKGLKPVGRVIETTSRSLLLPHQYLQQKGSVIRGKAFALQTSPLPGTWTIGKECSPMTYSL